MPRHLFCRRLTFYMAEMIAVVTLIAAESGGPLSPKLVEAARDALAGAGAVVGAPDWLAPGVACDLAVMNLTPAAAEPLLRERLRHAPIDWAVQPPEGRRKAILLADMESTIIAEEMLDELADALGLRAEIAAITSRSMAGELDFAASLRERVARLAGLPAAALDEAATRMTLNPGAATLIATSKAHGIHTVLVSGGFTRFAEPIAARCGFDEVAANRLSIENGRVAGTVAEPILDRAAKRTTLERVAAERGLGPAAVCAVGDGANDVDMLRAAGLGVAYRAQPAARGAARVRIDHGDLTALLYLQGYRQSELHG